MLISGPSIFTDLNATDLKIGLHMELKELPGIFCLDSIDLVTRRLF